MTRHISVLGAGGAILTALLGAACQRTETPLPKPPPPEEIAPFDANKLELFYQLSVEHTDSLLKNNRDVAIVDVRTPEHFAAGHLAGAVNLPFPSKNYEAEVKKLDPGAKVLIYGYHSAYLINDVSAMDAVNVLRAANYRQIYWMTLGYPGWIQAGKPVVDNAGQRVASPPLGPMPPDVPLLPASAPAKAE